MKSSITLQTFNLKLHLCIIFFKKKERKVLDYTKPFTQMRRSSVRYVGLNVVRV